MELVSLLVSYSKFLVSNKNVAYRILVTSTNLTQIDRLPCHSTFLL